MAKKSQTVIVVGQDRRLKKCSKPVFSEWLYDENNQEAWFVLRKLFSVFNFMKKGMSLVIDQRFALPLNPYHNYTPEELTTLTELDKRASQALNVVVGQAEKHSNNKIIALGLIVIVSAIVLLVIILALLVASGRMG